MARKVELVACERFFESPTAVGGMPERDCLERPCLTTSSSQEPWRSLLEEGLYTLVGVVSRYDRGKGSFLDGQALVYRGIHASMNPPECAGQRKWWFAGEKTGEGESFLEELCPGDDAIDESQPCSFSCIKAAAGEDQFNGSFASHISWQALCATEGRNDPNVDLGLAEGGRIRRERDVR